MIENTFQIIPSVSTKREKAIWNSGVLTWKEFIDTDAVKGMSCASKERSNTVLEEATGYLDDDDAFSLGGMLPRGEHWRLYRRFRKDVAFLDIETDGLERDSTVTVVTVCKGDDTITLVEGRDLDAESLSDALGDPSMLVTFNGSCFDVPVLRYSFPALDLDLPHFDLRFGCRKVGYAGGLKNIEVRLGMKRSEDIENVDGMDAVRLWKQWTRAHDVRSLDTLIEYNRADTINLKALADIMYDKLVKEHAGFDP